jgi:hypothetical protein
MNSVLRRERLVEIVREQKSVSLQELIGHFDVSKMTLHRDLVLLESRGILRRFHGGVVLAEAESHPVPLPSALVQEQCVVCLRPVTPRLLYSITLTNGIRRYACCPHCGLAQHLSLGGEILSALATDFLAGRPHPAHRSLFLFESSATPCCHPSIITFEDAEQARRFQTGFGGTLATFDEALALLR